MNRMGRVALTMLVVAAACGPTPRPVAPAGPAGPAPGGAPGGAAPDVRPPPTPAAVCGRIVELRDAGCDLVSGYTLTEAECREDFRRSLEERGADARTANVALGRCLLDNGSCAAVEQCVTTLTGSAAGTGDVRACGTSGSEPVGATPEEWAARKGAGLARYSQAQTTKDEPVEVCGIPAQMEWLLGLTCDDGSRPFTSYDHAHAARAGNVGPGGRCGSIVDLYEVPCPEGTYQIFIDAYVCPLPGD